MKREKLFRKKKKKRGMRIASCFMSIVKCNIICLKNQHIELYVIRNNQLLSGLLTVLHYMIIYLFSLLVMLITEMLVYNH